MKNIAFTPRGYLQSRRNRYDLFVTVLGVTWIFIHATFKVSIYRIHYLWKVWINVYIISEWLVLLYWIHGGNIKVFYHNWKTCHIKNVDADCRRLSMQKFFHYIWYVPFSFLLRFSWNNYFWYCKIWRRNWKVYDVYFIYVFILNTCINRRANFESPVTGVAMLFRIVTGEDWNKIMHDCMIQPPYCTPADNYWQTDCGNFTGSLVYFCTFYVIITYIVLNLLVGNFFTNITHIFYKI